MNVFHYHYKNRTKRVVCNLIGVPLDGSPSDTRLHRSKRELILCRFFNIEWEYFVCESQNHSESMSYQFEYVIPFNEFLFH